MLLRETFRVTGSPIFFKARANSYLTQRHVAVVQDMLAAADLTEDDLGCPRAWPADGATRDELVRDRAAPSRIRMVCSGKHAAMLLACPESEQS